MPNYVTNFLYAKGVDKARFEQIKAFVGHGNAGCDFDFNKIIPMPDELSVVDGTITTEVVRLYEWYCRPDSQYDPRLGIDEETFESIRMTEEDGIAIFGRGLPLAIDREKDLEADKEKLSRSVSILTDPEFRDVKLPALCAGFHYVRNKLHYGYYTWYGWACQYWGTKWNAMETGIQEDEESGLFCWKFETAWSAPFNVIRVLSVIFPEVSFELQYADEDIGCNCGIITYRDGEVIDEIYTNKGFSYADAQKFAIDLIYGGTPEENGYRLDPESNRYHYVEE